MEKMFHVFKLCFHRTLHLGTGTDFYDRSEDLLHSDTLYAAITSIAAQAGVLPDDQPSFTLTSAFPYVEINDRTEYFLPKIVMPHVAHDEKDSTSRKVLKNLKWLNRADFEKAINGQDFPNFKELNERIRGPYLFGQPVSPSDDNLPFVRSVTQRVTVPRKEGEDARPYYVEKLFFRPGAGLFVMVESDDASADWLHQAFKLLGASGIGTDRNVGCGHFEVIRDSLKLTFPEDANASSNLSLYLPRDKEELAQLLEGPGLKAHRLLERGGWISTEPFQTLRKHSINMIAEGAVLSPLSNAPCSLGRTVDLRPEGLEVNHPVLRCGNALFIPVRTQ